MERAKKARTPFRAKVTRVCNDIETEIASQVPQKKVLDSLLKLLIDAKEKLSTKDEEVLQAMLDENKTDEELEAEDLDNEQYFRKIIEAESLIEFAVNTQQVGSTSVAVKAENDMSGGQGGASTFKLPKIELPKFNGDLKTWLGWWSQFQKIDTHKGLHDSDKFQYLIQATEDKSEPREIVCAFPPTGENYMAAIDTLKRRYGREGLQLQVYLRELLNLVIANVTKKDKIPLDKLFMKLESYIRALSTLDLSKAEPSMYFYPLVESSLPEDVLRTWLRNTNKDSQEESKDKLEDLMNFIKKEVEGDQQIALAQNAFQEKPSGGKSNGRSGGYQKQRDDTSTSSSLYTGSASDCVFCGKSNHNSKECFKARKMTIEEKRKVLQDASCCFNCFRKGHSARKCKLKVSCFLCSKSHQTIMCTKADRQESTNSKVEEITEQVKTLTVQSAPPSTSSFSGNPRSRVVLMKTLHILAKGESDKEIKVRLLFDEGSQCSYIRTELAKKLNCKKIGELRMQNCLFGGQVTEVKKRNKHSLQIRGLNGSYANCRRDVVLVNEHTIANSCPTIPQGSWMQELSRNNIQVTDTCTDSTEVDILIGSDLWGSLMTGKMIKLNCGLIAVESIFGWTVSGEIMGEVEESYAAVVTSLTVMNEKTLPDLWSLEAIGISDSPDQITQEEEDLLLKESFQDSITRGVDGRYSVKLPWTCEKAILPDNRAIAVKRLENATKKLIDQNEFYNYDKIFRDWTREGIIDSVENNSSKGHFLPHRPVFKPESLTTPVRPVFDASCRSGKGPSLNDCLSKGPNLLELIPSILLRFREKKVGVISDIRKAFQMIEVCNEETNYQKFLWWENWEDRRMIEFRHKRVVFGINCSPFVLAAVLDFHLKNVEDEDKQTALDLARSLYVDNSVISFDTREEYVQFREKSTRILSDGKFDLRQWETNLLIENGKFASVLGLKWNREKDTLHCQLPKNKLDEKITKRSVLSFVSQVYDPIGVLCPATLLPKLLIQQSWESKVGWDDEWEGIDTDKFRRWRMEIDDLGRIELPRHAFGEISKQKLQFHCFTDASQSAYAAVVFVRVEDDEGVKIQLLAAKSRLAPISKNKKRVTIPRLELLGCFIGSILTDRLRKDLSMENIPTFYWSDSTTALAWIRREADWGTFVGNRVSTIRKTTRGTQWRHVPGNMNPADLPSRGCSPSLLLQSKWWEGPEWLKREEAWPNFKEEFNEEEIVGELRKTPLVANLIQGTEPPHFSSYFKNVRVAAWIRRFVSNCQAKKGDRVRNRWSTPSEMSFGERDILIQIQRKHFLPGQKFKSMQVKAGQDGLLRVVTRLTFRNDWDNFKNPILLPSSDIMVEQLINEVHRMYCHAGTQFLLNKLREKYWILHGRKTVGRIIRKCVTCRRFSVKSFDCNPAPLPQYRIESQAAFQTTGLDLAGPLIMKGGKKAWIVIFTDAVYRGVYLDWVESISTADFVDCLEKFTNTVGRPSTLCSDNGTNFVGTKNLMKKLDWKKLEGQLHVKQIRWTFNPPTAAWWGGWWERLIKTMKDLLRRMLGNAKLTFKGLTSCLSAVSYVMNNRPLTTLNEDTEDLSPLTPAMFMKDLPVCGLPEVELITSQDLQDSYQKVQDMKKTLMERFRKEYLGLLIQKSQEKSSPPPEVGQVVLVGMDNKKRCDWPLGRIIELNPGRDGKVRVAKVRTRTGILTRPLQRLHPLEVPQQKSMPSPPEVLEVKNMLEEVTDVTEEVLRTKSGRKVKKTNFFGYD